MVNTRFGWHSGNLKCKDLTLSGDLSIEGTMTFGDASTDTLTVNGASQFNSTITVGENDTGKDVKFFGATSGAYMLWDESADDLILAGAAGLSVAGASTLAGIVQINDNVNLQFEGIADDSDGLTIACDNAGDATISVTAGGLTLSTSDNAISMSGETLTVGTLTDGTLSITGGNITSVGSITATNVQVTNVKANDGTACLSITDSTGALGIAVDSTIATDKKLYFRDSGLNIYSSSDGQLDIVADTTLALSGACTMDSSLSIAGVLNPDGGITFDSGASDLANPLMMDAIGDTTTAVVAGSLGNIIKIDANSAVTHTVTSAGLLVKGYFEDCTIDGNYEMSGQIVMLKHKATLSGGAKSSLASFHRHASSTGTVDYGLRLFGEVTTGISLETGATNLLQVPAAGTNPVASAAGETLTPQVKIQIDVGGTPYVIHAGTSA